MKDSKMASNVREGSNPGLAELIVKAYISKPPGISTILIHPIWVPGILKMFTT
jgi:hypothetical protein